MTAVWFAVVVWAFAVVGVCLFMAGATRHDRSRELVVEAQRINDQVARNLDTVEAQVVALENYRQAVKDAQTVAES